MRRDISIVAMAPVLLLCLASMLAAEDAVELKVTWQVGKCYVQTLEMAQEQTMAMPDPLDPIVQKRTESDEIATSVTRALEDGGRELEMVFRSIKKKADTPRGTMSIDSTKDDGRDPNPLYVVMRELMGSRIRYLIGPDGGIKKATRISDTDSSTPGEKPSDAGMFGEESLKGMCPQSLVEGLPAKPVKPGDTWSSKPESMEVAGWITVQIEMKHTFKGYEDLDKHRCAVIESTGTIKEGAGKKDTPAGMKVSLKEGKASGKVWFDLELGMARKSTVDHTIKLETSLTLPGMMEAVATTVDQVQHTSVVLTSVGDIEKKERKE